MTGPIDVRACVDPQRVCPFSEEAWLARLREIESATERTNSLLKWGMGLMVSIGLVVSSLIYQGIDNRVRVLESDGSPAMREKLARTEGRLEGIAEDVKDIKAGQKEILSRLAQ
jgi:hypothetical protein